MQRNPVALLPRGFGVDENGGVVAANFGGAGAVRGGAVEVFEDETVDGVDAVVDAHGEDVDLLLLGMGLKQRRGGSSLVTRLPHQRTYDEGVLIWRVET